MRSSARSGPGWVEINHKLSYGKYNNVVVKTGKSINKTTIILQSKAHWYWKILHQWKILQKIYFIKEIFRI